MDKRSRVVAGAFLALSSLFSGCNSQTSTSGSKSSPDTVDAVVATVNTKTGQMFITDRKKINLAQVSKDFGLVGAGTSLWAFSNSAKAAEFSKPLSGVLKAEIAEGIAKRIESTATSKAMKWGAAAMIGTGIYFILTSAVNPDSNAPRPPTPEERKILARGLAAEQARDDTFHKLAEPSKTGK